jgi:hypothetical protein
LVFPCDTTGEGSRFSTEETVGAVATFHDITHIQAVETRVRQELYLKGHVAQFAFPDIVSQSPGHHQGTSIRRCRVDDPYQR